MFRRDSHIALFALALLAGCGESVAPPESSSYAAEDPILAGANGDPGRGIALRDQCGGDSWTAFGGCLIDGPVERPAWLARVQATGSHPLWAISPVATSVATGTTLQVVNVGGRPHTFTRVANFGGGIIPILNTGEDTQIPAPECLAEFSVVAPAGGSDAHTFTGVGEQHYQCCFHPWMRATVNVTAEHGN